MCRKLAKSLWSTRWARCHFSAICVVNFFKCRWRWRVASWLMVVLTTFRLKILVPETYAMCICGLHDCAVPDVVPTFHKHLRSLSLLCQNTRPARPGLGPMEPPAPVPGGGEETPRGAGPPRGVSAAEGAGPAAGPRAAPAGLAAQDHGEGRPPRAEGAEGELSGRLHGRVRDCLAGGVGLQGDLPGQASALLSIAGRAGCGGGEDPFQGALLREGAWGDSGGGLVPRGTLPPAAQRAQRLAAVGGALRGRPGSEPSVEAHAAEEAPRPRLFAGPGQRPGTGHQRAERPVQSSSGPYPGYCNDSYC